MKSLSIFIISSLLALTFTSCVSQEGVTKEECAAQGLVYKKEKVLNFRTGEYEMRSYCKQN